MAQNSCAELLRVEKLVIVAIKKMEQLINITENKFNDMVNSLAVDYAKEMGAIEKSSDLLAIEICTNFNDLLKACVDGISRKNVQVEPFATSSKTPSPSHTATKRKRTPNVGKRIAKKQKTSVATNEANSPKKAKNDNASRENNGDANGKKANDHTYTAEIEDDNEEVELIEYDDNPTTASYSQLGVVEDGQRMDSEFYF